AQLRVRVCLARDPRQRGPAGNRRHADAGALPRGRGARTRIDAGGGARVAPAPGSARAHVVAAGVRRDDPLAARPGRRLPDRAADRRRRRADDVLMARLRVLVGGFSMEANTFAPGETTLEDLRAQVFGVGAELHRDFMGPESELAGAWSALEHGGFEPVPSLAAWAGPSRPFAAGVVEELERLLLAPLDDSVDGAYVMLHGSCVAHDEDDPEGRVLTELRRRLGPGRPIVASLDCHANLTEAMVAAVDAFTAYRTCPHVDTRRTGEQAGRLLAATLAGDVRPVTGVAARPMITPPDLHDSSRDPFRRLMALNDEIEAEGALASCLLPVQPWIDVPQLSWKAVVTTAGDRALAEALASPPPVVIGDAGDATNGGAIGDSTELLRAALRRGGANVLLS